MTDWLDTLEQYDVLDVCKKIGGATKAWSIGRVEKIHKDRILIRTYNSERLHNDSDWLNFKDIDESGFIIGDIYCDVYRIQKLHIVTTNCGDSKDCSVCL